jgi:hypothetical protein
MTQAHTIRGFSDAAEFSRKSAEAGWQRLRATNTFGSDSALYSELASVWDDCQVPNWDGYKASPVDPDALRNTYQLLESLPLGFPAPSIGAEPDGHLTLEWHRSPRRTLSVSVDGDGNLHYAALLGPNRAYGTEAFFDEFPDTIRELVWKVYSA